MSKGICVIDTCSLRSVSQIELGGVRIIERIYEVYDIIAPKTVLNEFSQSEGYDPATYYTRVMEEVSFNCCLEVIERWFNKNNLQKEYNQMAQADRHCIALALYMSRREKKMTVLLTDDFRATPWIKEFFRAQKIGLTLSTPEIIIHIFTLFSAIGSDHVRYAINDFLNKTQIQNKSLSDSFWTEFDACCRRLCSDFCNYPCIRA